MKELTDDDLMPFGKYKGQPMSDVPAHYLHWLWYNGMKDDTKSPVAAYIKENMHVLKSENSDLIWD